MTHINGMDSVQSFEPVQRETFRPEAQGTDNSQTLDELKKTQDKVDPLENTVSVSEDGDTVQVSEQSKDKLEDDRFGKVTVKGALQEEEQKDNVTSAEEQEEVRKEIFDEIMEEAEAAADKRAELTRNAVAEREGGTVERPISTMGRTSSQLQQMYREGDISKNDLDRALERREEQISALRESEEAFTEKTVGLDRLSKQQKADAKELEKLYAFDSSETIDASTRAEILRDLENKANLISQ